MKTFTECVDCREREGRHAEGEMTKRPAAERVEQARKNAAWWRVEIAAGRIKTTPELNWMLVDLKSAGGLR